MLETVLFASLAAIALSMIGLIFRVIKGPSTPDRVIALDGIGINLIAIVAILSILLRTSAFLEVILLLGILAYIGTVAFAKFLEKGVIIERDRNNH
ncbi:multisubunit sodium/proton antiporter MrpF subunit [Bacillus oleivorans]|uniref:Multisubunit sodium/proton antiporter MrpF subunit n=2 Tax=Bacillus oleivorans TaxID=1448271 RepID=A0A285D6F8_9BACI|nr:Na(+)/H(+) antiporter subunit F1 [Bacillus oleivorans]SNX75235.1 multisubunit sodium/proton antiporter MrpF subunit [Bacillus oleivorans]